MTSIRFCGHIPVLTSKASSKPVPPLIMQSKRPSRFTSKSTQFIKRILDLFNLVHKTFPSNPRKANNFPKLRILPEIFKILNETNVKDKNV